MSKSEYLSQIIKYYRGDRERHLVEYIKELEAVQFVEICICAALRLPDGRIFRGHRHGDCIWTAHNLVEYEKPGSWEPSMCEDQGFITSLNRYVDREVGLSLQKAAGIPSACPSGYRKSHLFSEDLY